MTTQPRTFKSIMGKRLGVGAYGQLAAQNPTAVLDITPKCVDASITVGAEAADVRAITITLKDVHGNAIDYAETVDIVMLLNSGGTDFVATGGSTGIAIGASGKLLAIVAKKVFKAISTTSGVIALTWTDTGTEAAFLGLYLPNGTRVISSTLQNA
ncbi:hypothetical protein EN858_14925 [Mesorhizobium sp. M4B.F.Ca.ET.215.01.1.1]|uniref:hypothetical protein n=1 Tax=unclassified Mesorhizobium TaxID=325217 RepID=UPI0010933AAB|nr:MULTISPECIES: hypothetical protein [unclassified Mesorhizobium]TGQ11213.1 hypothetical protein EN858_14925 [Mesorhizobium sp. M4B.F.Ca.ET.215.01.1.1]TGR04734.1 hypothetical protein EN846_13155 [Mesorhizobium sp. M4B.F.Ca.ET.203.01.1.1]